MKYLDPSNGYRGGWIFHANDWKLFRIPKTKGEVKEVEGLLEFQRGRLINKGIRKFHLHFFRQNLLLFIPYFTILIRLSLFRQLSQIHPRLIWNYFIRYGHSIVIPFSKKNVNLQIWLVTTNSLFLKLIYNSTSVELLSISLSNVYLNFMEKYNLKTRFIKIQIGNLLVIKGY